MNLGSVYFRLRIIIRRTASCRARGQTGNSLDHKIMSDLNSKSWTLQAPVHSCFVALLILLISGLVYSPGLTGGFAFDDYPNILQNTAITDGDMSLGSLAQVAWSGSAGPLKRPISLLSFALNYYSTGVYPLGFKNTNLAIHLVNGLLVLWFSGLILRARASLSGTLNSVQMSACALAVSAIWLVHPINLTSVLHVVQRMNSLASGFALLAIICYCCGRFRLIAGRSHGNLQLYLGFSTFTILGVLCKENALLALPLAGAIELCFFRLRTHTPRDRIFLGAFFSVALVIPCIFACTYLLIHPEWLSLRYEGRPFSLLERCLT